MQSALRVVISSFLTHNLAIHMPSIIWFRRDLRVADNTALFHAAKQSNSGVIGLYFITPGQWQQHDEADCKVKFWLGNLATLSAELNKLRIPLRIEICDKFDEIPENVVKFARKYKCDSIFANREYEVNERQRDLATLAACAKADIPFQLFHDRVIVPPNEILTKEGKFYSVFTPYRKVWDTKALDLLKVLPKPKKQPEPKIKPSRIPKSVEGFDFEHAREDLWVPGENEARKRITKFVKIISGYDTDRDLPSVNGTSLLSPYLTAGVVSPRQCLVEAVAANRGKIGGVKGSRSANQGAVTWTSELTWRDFYTQVLVACPRVSKHHPFKLKRTN